MKIMLIDDQPEYLTGVLDRLESLGHTVILKTDAKEALRDVKRDYDTPAAFDAVITDYIMPFRGSKVVIHLEESCPSLPVLLWSSNPMDCKEPGVICKEKAPRVLEAFLSSITKTTPGY